MLTGTLQGFHIRPPESHMPWSEGEIDGAVSIDCGGEVRDNSCSGCGADFLAPQFIGSPGRDYRASGQVVDGPRATVRLRPGNDDRERTAAPGA
jgi:hypothetical protein